MRACVAGWGTALPEQRLTNADLERRVDTTDQWIVERTGIRERRVAAPGETTASLAIEAGAAAIKHAGLTPDAIDLLVVATATPEQLIPHTGAFVADGLGIHCGSFDLNAGCAGFVYELVVGSSMLASGNLQHVLVIGAETLSRFVDPLDRATCILFGDGAAAFVLSASPDDGPGILSWELGCDGSAHRPPRCSRPGAAGARRPPRPSRTASTSSRWSVPEVFRRAVRIVIESATTALDRAGVSVDDLTWFAPHQANIRIIEAAARATRDPARAHARQHRSLRKHECRVDPARPRRGRRRRAHQRR